MKTLFIVRHGETDNNQKHIIQGRSLDASINHTGRKQADEIARFLMNEDIEKVICSSLRRTHETASPFLEQRGLKAECYEDLDEINFGELEGKEFPKIQDKVKAVHQQWKGGNVDYAPKHGESPRETYNRANRKVREVLEASPESRLVFMLHGRLIRILLSEWLGHGLKNMHLIKHQNGAINKLTFKDGIFEKVYLNKVDHLTHISSWKPENN